jgi:hypothetical protein
MRTLKNELMIAFLTMIVIGIHYFYPFVIASAPDLMQLSGQKPAAPHQTPACP